MKKNQFCPKLPSLQRGMAYSLAASAAAVSATDAEGAVVYSGIQNISIGQFNSQQLNLDGDSYSDIEFKNFVFYGGNYQGAYVNFFPGKVIGINNPFPAIDYASALTAGAEISPSTTSGGPFQVSLAYGSSNPSAEFNSATGAFIGLEFPISGINHFGWIRVDINNAAGTFVIRDWAYNNSPGVGISAGSTVPEPSTLGMLAAGSMGLLAMRRKKHAA
jgi:hypothetical protein